MDLLREMFRVRQYTPPIESTLEGRPCLAAGSNLAIITADVSKKVLTTLMAAIGDACTAGVITIVSTSNKLPSTLTRRALSSEHNIEFFTEAELRLNAMFHRKMPSYTVVDHTGVGALQRQYQIDVNALPILASSDPVSRYHGFHVGSVVKIERDGRVWYRIVRDLTQ